MNNLLNHYKNKCFGAGTGLKRLLTVLAAECFNLLNITKIYKKMKQNCVLYTIIYRKNCKTQTKMINNIKKVLHCIVHYDMMQTVQ